jgi:hypothetical protein
MAYSLQYAGVIPMMFKTLEELKQYTIDNMDTKSEYFITIEEFSKLEVKIQFLRNVCSKLSIVGEPNGKLFPNWTQFREEQDLDWIYCGKKWTTEELYDKLYNIKAFI